MSLIAYNKTAAPLALAAGNPIVTLPAASSVGARGAAFNVTAQLKPNLTVDPVNGLAGGLSASDYTLLQNQVAAGQVEYQWTAEPEYVTALSSASSSLTGALTTTSTTVVVSSAAGFPTSGIIRVDLEYITYTSISGGNTFNGLSRGALGSTVLTHNAGVIASTPGLEIGSAMDDLSDQPVTLYVNGATGSDNNAGTLSAPLQSFNAALNKLPPSQKSSRVIFDSDMGILSVQQTARVYTSITGFQQIPRVAAGTNLVMIGARRTLTPSQSEGVGGSNQTLTGTMPATTVSDNPLASGAVTINVASTAAFPTSGVLQVDSEIIRYTGITATSFTGCLRGYASTTAASHVLGSSIFLFMAGYYVRITDGLTSATVTDNPLSATANVVNVSATAGYPASGVIQIGSEFITYTAVTATAFTGCTRGILALGGAPASHASGSTVHGGVNFAQRRKIKSNTATTVTTDTNFTGNFAVTDKFTIEAPATQLNQNNWKLNCSQMAFKDLILKNIAGNSFEIAGFWTASGCSLQMAGNNAFIAQDTSNFRGSTASAISAIYLLEGAASPFAGAEDGAGGLRLEGEALSIPFCTTGGAGVLDGANITTVGVNFSFNGGAIMTSSGAGSNVFNSYGGNFTLTDGANVRLEGGVASNLCSFSICPINLDLNSTLRTDNLVSNNAIGSAITVGRNSVAQIATMTGTGATRYGVETLDNGTVRMTNTGATVTGALGDIKCGSRQARTWTDFNNATPASGLPSKNEFDVPEFTARPIKVVLTGLTATDVVNITAPTAPATTEAIDNPLSATASVVNVAATAGFATTGWIKIGSEVISYTGVTGTSFTGCSRGQQGTTAATHALGAAVLSWNQSIASASSVRVVAGVAGFLGTYMLGDTAAPLITAGGNTVVGVAQLSDDGTTITFPAGTQATAVTIEYTPTSPVASGARIYQD